MRSKNYQDMKASFKPLSPKDMVRIALVNGILPWVEPNRQDRLTYLELLREFSNLPESRLDQLFHLAEVAGSAEPAERKSMPVTASLEDVHYDAHSWKTLDYRRLKEAGVIVDFKFDGPNLGLLVQNLFVLPRHKVIELSKPIERDGVDYLKHVPAFHKLVLNGRDVVVEFADEHGIRVPEGYMARGGPAPVSMYDDLARAGFTFKAALESADRVMKGQEYAGRDISVLVIKHLNGDELRMHHHDFIEAAELYVNAKWNELQITEVLGDKLKPDTEGKYALNVFDTPSRSRRGVTHRVELSYLPDFEDERHNTLGWMKTRAFCNCEWALNLRNFNFGRGETTHTASTLETHSGLVVLQLQMRPDGTLQYSPQNMNPLPQVGFLRFTDTLRYQVMKGHRDNDYVHETGIEIALNQFWRMFGIINMYWPREKIGSKVLDTFY